MLFKNRVDAGRRLAEALSKHKGEDAVVYALPRGGVILGYEVASHLGIPLDLIITRKIGYPGNEECAACAVAEDGHIICDHTAVSLLDQEWLKAQARKEMQEAKRRRKVYLKGRAPLSIAGKVAIIIDDGVATGLTLLLAIKELRHNKPEKIIVAVPVSSASAAERIRTEADELIVLEVSSNFESVGSYYETFTQLTDEEVIRLMENAMNEPFRNVNY